jgi:hypothetical protein
VAHAASAARLASHQAQGSSDASLRLFTLSLTIRSNTLITRRPHQGRGMNVRRPIHAFDDGMPKASNTEVTSQTKTTKLKAA